MLFVLWYFFLPAFARIVARYRGTRPSGAKRTQHAELEVDSIARRPKRALDLARFRPAPSSDRSPVAPVVDLGGVFPGSGRGCGCRSGLEAVLESVPQWHLEPRQAGGSPVAALSKAPDPQASPQEKLDALSSATVKYRVTPFVFSKDFFDSQETRYSGGGVRFTWILEPDRLEKIKRIVSDAYALEMTLPRTLDESYLNTRFNGNQRRMKPWGITLLPNFPAWAIPLIDIWETLFPESRQDYAKSSIELFSSAVDSSKAIIVVATHGNTPELQVRTGVPLQRLWMEVLSAGGSLLPLSQALQEYPEMEELRSAIHQEASQPGETIQMLLSLGKPEGAFIRSPRIPANELFAPKVQK